VGASLSYMTWAEAQNMILQEELQSFHQLTVISAVLKELPPSLANSEGGLCLTGPLSSERKTQKTAGEETSRKRAVNVQKVLVSALFNTHFFKKARPHISAPSPERTPFGSADVLSPGLCQQLSDAEQNDAQCITEFDCARKSQPETENDAAEAQYLSFHSSQSLQKGQTATTVVCCKGRQSSTHQAITVQHAGEEALLHQITPADTAWKGS